MGQALTNPYTAFAIDLAIDVLLKATIVLAVAGIAAWYLRCGSAATRHAVWSVALGCLLLLPILSGALPAWKLGRLYVSMETETVLPSDATQCCSERLESSSPAARPAATRGTVGTRGTSPAVTVPFEQADSQKSAASGASPVAIALVIWLLGVLALLGRLGVDTLRIRCITRRASNCSSAAVHDLARRLAVSLGIRRRIRILVSDEVKVPLTWGAWTPAVILPEAMATWSTQRTHIVLLHELAHIRRWDWAVLLMVEVVCAIYWFNPLVWIAAKQGAMERERACDDQALYAGVRSDVYASHLFEIARAQVSDDAPRAAFAMAQPSSLATRFRSILARELDRAPMSQGRLFSTAVAALLFALPLASVDIWGTVQVGDSVEQRVRQLQDDDPLVRRHAAWALGELESSRGVRPLIEGLTDENADVRLVAAWALGEIKDDIAIYPLVERLDDDDPFVREMAVLALGEIENPSAIDPLIESLDRHPELREPAIWALGEIGNHEAERARSAVFAQIGRRGWDNQDVWSGYLGSDAARRFAGDLSALIDALDDDDPKMRRSAAEWLGLRGEQSAVDPLLDALRDPEPSVRAMAIWALDEINPSRHQNTE